MKTKIFLIASLVLSFYAQISFAQEKGIDINRLRKVVLHSDVILAGSYKATTNNISDYSIERYLIVRNIDTMMVNTSNFTINQKVKIRQEISDYALLWGSDCMCGMSLEGRGMDKQRYSNILFLSKNNKQYELIGGIGLIEWNVIIDNYLPVIQKIKSIDKIKNINERYSKTIDLYIENNDFPDDYFIDFYKQKAIIKDTLVLTNQQLQQAKEKFLQGNEKLLPFLGNQFSTEINEYYWKKLKDIREISKPTYFDYIDFQDIISGKYEFRYNSVDYILLDQLSSDNIDEDNTKQAIMDYFIQMFEKDNNLGNVRISIPKEW